MSDHSTFQCEVGSREIASWQMPLHVVASLAVQVVQFQCLQRRCLQCGKQISTALKECACLEDGDRR